METISITNECPPRRCSHCELRLDYLDPPRVDRWRKLYFMETLTKQLRADIVAGQFGSRCCAAPFAKP
jgi:hypothetical protein